VAAPALTIIQFFEGPERYGTGSARIRSFRPLSVSLLNQPPADKQTQREHNEHAAAVPHLRLVAHRSGPSKASIEVKNPKAPAATRTVD
jgi:hypothetical protein